MVVEFEQEAVKCRGDYDVLECWMLASLVSSVLGIDLCFFLLSSKIHLETMRVCFAGDVERKMLGEKQNGVAVLVVESQNSACALLRTFLRAPPWRTSYFYKISEWRGPLSGRRETVWNLYT